MAEREHEFTLALRGDWDDLTDEMADRLYEAGCDDGTVGMRGGRITITFAREAPTMLDALTSAIRDVRKAGFEVDRIAECELISQADIARRTGRVRQQIGQWASGSRPPKGFPPPACYSASDSPLWRWAEVAHWLYVNDLAGKELWDDAEAIATVDAALHYQGCRQVDPRFDAIVGELGETGARASR